MHKLHSPSIYPLTKDTPRNSPARGIFLGQHMLIRKSRRETESGKCGFVNSRVLSMSIRRRLSCWRARKDKRNTKRKGDLPSKSMMISHWHLRLRRKKEMMLDSYLQQMLFRICFIVKAHWGTKFRIMTAKSRRNIWSRRSIVNIYKNSQRTWIQLIWCIAWNKLEITTYISIPKRQKCTRRSNLTKFKQLRNKNGLC